MCNTIKHAANVAGVAKRITACFVVFLVAASCFFVPASAAEAGDLIDPYFYKSEKYEEDGVLRATINGVNNLTGGATIINGTTKYFIGTSVTTNTSSTFRLYWYPFGANSRTDISTIRAGSTVKVHWFIYESSNDYFIGSAEFGVEFFNSSGKSLGSQWFSNLTANGYEYSSEFTWSPPSGAVSAYFISRTSWTYSSGTVSYKWQLTSFVLDYELAYDPDDWINGNHGFDSGGSDFSSSAGDLNDSSAQLGDAMSGGMDVLSSMMSSSAFLSTLTTLSYAIDALFEGHEITICGYTANPFELLVSVFAIAILIPLALKFIFRKWGSGGSGGDSDA